MKTILPAILALCCLGATVIADAQQGKNEPVNASLYWSHSGVKPGGHITLAVVLDVLRPYHINSDKAKYPVIPTTVELTNLPPELRGSTPVFPPDQEISLGMFQEKVHGFTGRTAVYLPMAVVGSARPGEMEVKVNIKYQTCNENTCLRPSELTQKAKLNVLAAGAEGKNINQEIFVGLTRLKERLHVPFFGWDFDIEPANFSLLLLVAAIGGLLLNFTPCVLPLIPIKILGLAQAAGNHRRCLLLGLSLSAGVVVFWMSLAVAVSSIHGFNSTNKLFQYPAFTIGVGIVIWAMAIGMCGLTSVRLPQVVYFVNPSHETVAGSFLFGIMTAVLSTPCTAPFMGAAAAWSATQAPAITLGMFAAIGAGMALPYLILSAFPVLVNRMPRAGPASELIKQVMGLLMFAAGGYFFGTGIAGFTARPPDPPTNVYWWLVAFFVAAAGAWLCWQTFRITQRVANRVICGGLGVVLIVLALAMGFHFTKQSPINWVYYTPQRLTEAQKAKKVVVLEFTAAWCLNCDALEKFVLHNPRVVQLLNSNSVAPIKVDLTANNPAGDEKLVEVGRRTIPYLVVNSADGKEIFASDAYTVEQLIAALKHAWAVP